MNRSSSQLRTEPGPDNKGPFLLAVHSRNNRSTQHVTFLRDLKPHTRFMLKRNGERYFLVGPTLWKNKWVYQCIREADGKATTLHHSCHVKPIIRAEAPYVQAR